MRTSWLVDTNVLSELARRDPHPQVLAWADRVGRVALSVITLEELLFGLHLRPAPRVQKWLEEFLEEGCEILPVHDGIAGRAGQMRGRSGRTGVVRSQADCLIAATAEVHDLTLVTRNVKDFLGWDLRLLNPFDEP